MLLIAQKDKEWKTSYHPCLPTTYYLLCPHTTAASVSDAPIAVNQDVNTSLARLSFSTCSLFIPSPWCSSLTFIAPVNEILFCCVYSPAVLSLARPRSPSPVYSLRVTSGVIVVQGPCPSTAVGATWSNNHDHMSMYSWFPMAFLTTWLINSRRAKALFILLFSREYTQPPRRRDTAYFRLNK